MSDRAEIRRTEVKSYMERSYHVGCGGEWINQGDGISDTFATTWMHRCDKCKQIYYLTGIFPRIVSE